MSTGYLFDSNVNAGPESDTVAFFGIPFALTPDSKSQSDRGITSNVAFNHLLPYTDKVSLRSSLNFASVTYVDESDFNLEQFGILVGPQVRNGRFIVGVPFVL